MLKPPSLHLVNDIRWMRDRWFCERFPRNFLVPSPAVGSLVDGGGQIRKHLNDLQYLQYLVPFPPNQKGTLLPILKHNNNPWHSLTPLSYSYRLPRSTAAAPNLGQHQVLVITMTCGWAKYLTPMGGSQVPQQLPHSNIHTNVNPNLPKTYRRLQPITNQCHTMSLRVPQATAPDHPRTYRCRTGCRILPDGKQIASTLVTDHTDLDAVTGSLRWKLTLTCPTRVVFSPDADWLSGYIWHNSNMWMQWREMRLEGRSQGILRLLVLSVSFGRWEDSIIFFWQYSSRMGCTNRGQHCSPLKFACPVFSVAFPEMANR